MKYVNILLILSLLLALSACTGARGGISKGGVGAGVGAGLGAVLGQAIGRSTAGTVIGTAVGAGLGYIIGNEWDKYDQQQVNQMYETAPSHQTSSWVNPDTGNQYAMTPQPAYQSADGQWCRKAEIDSWIEGQKKTVTTTACRSSGGEWVIQR